MAPSRAELDCCRSKAAHQQHPVMWHAEQERRLPANGQPKRGYYHNPDRHAPLGPEQHLKVKIVTVHGATPKLGTAGQIACL